MDLGSKYGTYLNGSPLKKAMLKSGDEIDICDLRIICKENTLYFYNLHETPGTQISERAKSSWDGDEYCFYAERVSGIPFVLPRIRESLLWMR